MQRGAYSIGLSLTALVHLSRPRAKKFLCPAAVCVKTENHCHFSPDCHNGCARAHRQELKMSEVADNPKTVWEGGNLFSRTGWLPYIGAAIERTELTSRRLSFGAAR